MPWPSEQKQKSRERIVNSAVKLFTAHGYDNVTIGDVMKSAELTHGGFYSHFRSKQELYAEAIVAGARAGGTARMTEEVLAEEELLTSLLSSYLNLAHVHQEVAPCPLAFLATDVANREAEVRSAYTRVFKLLVARIKREMPGKTPSRGDRALALSAMMIGGVAVARALDDERTINALLKACNKMGDALIHSEL